LPRSDQTTSIFDGPYYLSIAGKLVGSKDSFDVINPATEEVLAPAPSATPERKPRLGPGRPSHMRTGSSI